MNKRVLLTLAAALGVVGFAQAASDDVSGLTFLTVRPQFQSPMPEKSSLFWPGQHELRRDDGWGAAFQGVVFGGRSTGGKNQGKYFMFGGLNELLVAGDNAPGVNGEQGIGRNVNAASFNIGSLTGGNQIFTSTIAFRPQQSVVGGGFEFRSYISWWGADCNGDPRWWFDVSFPVVRVKNDMRLSETVVTAQTVAAPGSAPNITAAFTGAYGFASTSTWAYGKINGSRQRTGVADVEIKIGWDYILNPSSYVSGYIGVVAPTGNRPKAEYVFEPVVGNNGHVGIITGGFMGFELMDFCQGGLFLQVETNARYLFANHQVRSFDLYNRPWSRYMPVFTAAPTVATTGVDLVPGINVFTQPVKVHPHFQHSITTALLWERSGFEAELGYNFWARQAEGVRLRDGFAPTTAIATITTGAFDVEGVGTTGIPGVNRASTITANFTGENVEFTTAGVLVTVADLNLQSAASPATMTHTVYGALGYNWDCWCWPVFIGAGASYEFSTNNTSLNRWLAWGKLGISL